MTTSVAIGQGVNVNFSRFFQKLIDEHRPRRAHQRGLRDVFLHGVCVVGDYHGATAEYVTRTHQNRQSDFARQTRGFFRNQRRAVARLRNFQFVEQDGRSGGGLPQGRSILARCR